jgi:hypothetical protein
MTSSDFDIATVSDERPTNDRKEQHASPRAGRGGNTGHGWMMMICCIPMIVLAIALVATGVASAGLLFSALACTVMMAMMMRMMSGAK